MAIEIASATRPPGVVGADEAPRGGAAAELAARLPTGRALAATDVVDTASREEDLVLGVMLATEGATRARVAAALPPATGALRW